MSINLVLSGGGARGLAHLGIIKVLYERGIAIKQISGASSGAVIGAFIAAGYKPDEVLKIFIENRLMYQLRPAFNGGLFRMNKWEELLLKYFPLNTFESLLIPLTINATNINSGKTIYFSSGNLATPLLASCSVPGFFEPIIINGSQHVDGGVLNNLPVDPFIHLQEAIIASHVNPLGFSEQLDSVFKVVERSVMMAIRGKIESNMSHINLFIEPAELSRYPVFDFDNAEKIFRIGYTCASGLIEKLDAFK